MTTQQKAGAALAAGVALAMLAGHSHAQAKDGSDGGGNASHAAQQAIAYAKHQLGCPYVYGATGPCPAGFDCSGLTEQAWQAAGRSIPRTSEEQWAALPHVATSQRERGDLVFAPGSPIDPPPGHVGMLTGRNTVIEAYAAGYPVKQVSLSTFAATSGGITGFARP